MAHPNHETFSVVIPVNDEEKMKEFQEAMDTYAEEMNAYEEKISKELGCSVYAASDIMYLRSRSRWSQELEDEIIRLDKLGKHPPVLAGWSGESEDLWSEI